MTRQRPLRIALGDFTCWASTANRHDALTKLERFYSAIAEGGWPREADWLAQIKRLVAMTDKAMLDHYAVRSAPAES